MRKRAVLCIVTAALGALAGCSVAIRGGGDGTGPSGPITLDQASATITITRVIGAVDVSATATITDSSGKTIDLASGQRVRVSGIDLSGPDNNDQYAARLPIASTYTITVVEPTVGLKDTALDMPADFGIQSPDEGAVASLSGFRLEWTSPNNHLQVRIRLSQTVISEVKTETLGPFSDTGFYDLTLDQLGGYQFVQAAPLSITVTKISSVSSVAGFRSGTATAEVSATRTVVPGP
jgi:hypothetical protein